MTDQTGVSEHPLEINSVECSPLSGEKITVHLAGRWRGRRREPEAQSLLVVEADGRNHRFPALAQPRRPRLARPGAFAVSFELPAALESRLAEHASLLLGVSSVPLPAPPGARQVASREADSREDVVPSQVAAETWPRSADDLLEEAIAPLRYELKDRAEGEARVRGMFARAQAELEARTANQMRIEAAYADVRRELEQVRELVERERAERSKLESRAAAKVLKLQQQGSELRDKISELLAELAVATVSREAAISEAEALRGELDRLGAELAATREQGGGRGTGLNEAQALLAEARALTARMTQESHEALARTPGHVPQGTQPPVRP